MLFSPNTLSGPIPSDSGNPTQSDLGVPCSLVVYCFRGTWSLHQGNETSSQEDFQTEWLQQPLALQLHTEVEFTTEEVGWGEHYAKAYMYTIYNKISKLLKNYSDMIRCSST
jgi:hypothetical protein